MASTTRALVTALLVALLAGCGGHAAGVDAGRDGTDALLSCSSDQTRLVVNLTTASDRRTFCDCAAAVGGGYGQSKTCDAGAGAGATVVKTSADQATCVARFAAINAGCTATIADSLGCAAEAQLCNFTGSACRALLSCYSADGGI